MQCQMTQLVIGFKTNNINILQHVRIITYIIRILLARITSLKRKKITFNSHFLCLEV